MGEIKMKKAEAKEALEQLKEHIKKVNMEIGYYHPDMVYPDLKARILKKIKNKAKTKSEIALSLSKSLTTIAPTITKMAAEGIIVLHGEKQIKGKMTKTYKALAPQS